MTVFSDILSMTVFTEREFLHTPSSYIDDAEIQKRPFTLPPGDPPRCRDSSPQTRGFGSGAFVHLIEWDRVLDKFARDDAHTR